MCSSKEEVPCVKAWLRGILSQIVKTRRLGLAKAGLQHSLLINAVWNSVLSAVLCSFSFSFVTASLERRPLLWLALGNSSLCFECCVVRPFRLRRKLRWEIRGWPSPPMEGRTPAFKNWDSVVFCLVSFWWRSPQSCGIIGAKLELVSFWFRSPCFHGMLGQPQSPYGSSSSSSGRTLTKCTL